MSEQQPPPPQTAGEKKKNAACSTRPRDEGRMHDFASEFTHPSGAVHLTAYPGGFLGLWSSLAGRDRRFPVKFLADANQTLQEFVQKRGEP